jgi:hypothetical protein
MHGRLRRQTVWIVVFAFAVILPLPVSARVGKNVASEFLEQSIEEGMAAADILSRLATTVGVAASADPQPTTQQLREGLFVTALPHGSHVLLRVEVTRTDTEERETITEVALSAELGRTFVTLVEAALTTADTVFTTLHVAAPWELQLHAESPSGRSRGDGQWGCHRALHTRVGICESSASHRQFYRAHGLRQWERWAGAPDRDGPLFPHPGVVRAVCRSGLWPRSNRGVHGLSFISPSVAAVDRNGAGSHQSGGGCPF